MSAAASTIPAQSMKIAKVKQHICAIVTGVDLAQPIDAATRKGALRRSRRKRGPRNSRAGDITRPSCKPPVKGSASDGGPEPALSG